MATSSRVTGRSRRRVASVVTVAALVASGCALGAVPAAHAATDTLVVDFATATGEFKGGASGMLYGLSDDGVPTDAIIAGANPRNLTQKAPGGAQHPNGDPLLVEDAFFANGGEYMMTNIQDYYPDWPYNGGQRPADFSTYLDIVRTVVTDVVENSEHPEKYIFTPFNEPDGGNWYGNWGAMRETFLADWKAAYQLIREIYPEARIAGPGDSRWHLTRSRDFLTYAKANDVVPDMFTWHELGRGSLGNYRANYNQYRALEREVGIDPLPVNITEYAMRRDMSVPGQIVQWLALFEDTKVDAQTAYWTYAGNLNDNMAKNNSANGAWWLLKWYADLDGQTVAVTPPSLNVADTLQGIATVDDEDRMATVLFGGTNNEVKLDMSGLDPEIFGDTVDIQVREVEWSGQEGEAPAPPVIVAERVALDGTISLDIPNDNRHSAFQAVITPALSAVPAVDSTWRTSIEAENTVLRDVTAYNQSITDDWTFAASGGRDVGSTNRVTSALTWTVDVPTDGTYRFGAIAGVNGPVNGAGQHALFVDGAHKATIHYEAGFAWSYRGRGEATIDLTAGRHELSVRMSANGTSLLPGSDISLDKFDLTRIDGPESEHYPAILSRHDGDVDYAAGAAGAVRIDGAEQSTFFPSARDTGYYDVTVEYATEAATTLGMRVNGREIDGLAADAAGTWTSTARVHLAKGISEVVISAPEGAVVSALRTVRAVEGDSATTRIEAEDSSRVMLSGAARVENVAAPTNISGQQVGWIGNGEANYATVDRPSASAAGQYNLSVRYANAERNTGHDYNADVITRVLDITEEGGDTTRGAFRHNYSWKGFWTHTVPIDLVTPSGDLRLGNATGSAPNIDWLQLSPLVLSTSNTAEQAEPSLEVTAQATTRCVAGKTVLAVTVTNGDAVPAALQVETPYGSKSVAQLAAGKSMSFAFTTRIADLPGGEADITASASVGDETVTEAVAAPYSPRTCG
jgi:hypothetical protein